MTASWLMSLASLATGRIRRSQKTITYTYTIDTSRKPRRCSSRSRLSSSSSARLPSSLDSSSRSESTRLPNEIRPGHVIVYVGSERKRFIIPSIILNHHLFKLLLEKLDKSVVIARHDFPDPHDLDDDVGAILLPCEAEFLHRLLFLIDSGGECDQEMRWEELKKFLEDDSAKLDQ